MEIGCASVGFFLYQRQTASIVRKETSSVPGNSIRTIDNKCCTINEEFVAHSKRSLLFSWLVVGRRLRPRCPGNAQEQRQ